jgi:hypothetical protein
MGEGSKGTAASENDGLGTCEAHHVHISPSEGRGGAAGTVGEGPGGEEEGCLRVDSMLGLIDVASVLFPPEYRCVHAKGFDAK